MLHQWHMLPSSVTEEYDHAGSSECRPDASSTVAPEQRQADRGEAAPTTQAHVWLIWTKLQIEGRARDLAMFKLALDSKLRGCNLAHERPLSQAVIHRKSPVHPMYGPADDGMDII
jgi:hypothetical protein